MIVADVEDGKLRRLYLAGPNGEETILKVWTGATITIDEYRTLAKIELVVDRVIDISD